MKLGQTALHAIGVTEQVLLGKLDVLTDERTLKTLRKHGLVKSRVEELVASSYVTDKGRAVYRLDGYLPTPAVQEWLERTDLETGVLQPDYRTVQVRNACQAQGFVGWLHPQESGAPVGGWYITDLGRAIAGLPAGQVPTHDCAADGHQECSMSDRKAHTLPPAPALDVQTERVSESDEPPTRAELLRAAEEASARVRTNPDPTDAEWLEALDRLTDTLAEYVAFLDAPDVSGVPDTGETVPSPEAPTARYSWELNRAEEPRDVGAIVQELKKLFGPAELYTTLRGLFSGLLDELQTAAVREYKASLAGAHDGSDCAAHSCYVEVTEAVTEAMGSPFAGSDPDHWDGDDTEAALCAQWIRTAPEGARHQAARDLRAWAQSWRRSDVVRGVLSAADRIDPYEQTDTAMGPMWVRKSDRSVAPGPLIYQDEVDLDEATANDNPS